MAGIRKNVNLGLLLLIVASLVAFSIFSVYYHNEFRNLNDEYATKLGELQRVSADLGAKKAQLNQTSLELQLKEEKVEEFGSQYTELRSEKEAVDADNVRLNSELSEALSQLAAKSQELIATQATLQSTEAQLQDRIAEVASLEDDLDDLEDDYADACADLAALGGSC